MLVITPLYVLPTFNSTGVVDELRFGQYYSYASQAKTYGIDAGHIKRFSYWPQRLTNTQLTTYIS